MIAAAEDLAVDYDVLNAVLRGLVSAYGAGGGITAQVLPVRAELQVTSYEVFMENVTAAISQAGVEDGDIIAITSSVVSVAQRRFVPIGSIPKTTGVRDGIPSLMSLEKLAHYADLITEHHALSCGPTDILLSDTAVVDGREVILLAPERPNLVAFNLASRLAQEHTVRCDVVIKDSDAGSRCGHIVIGHPTVVATPLGATKGLSILDAMRVAAAAEALMGKNNRIPLVICRPANAVVRERAGLGQCRLSPFLDVRKETLMSSQDERI